MYRGLKTVWSGKLGEVTVERTSAILTNIETALSLAHGPLDERMGESHCNESRLCYRLSRKPDPRRPSTGTMFDDIGDRITHSESAPCKRPTAAAEACKTQASPPSCPKPTAQDRRVSRDKRTASGGVHFNKSHTAATADAGTSSHMTRCDEWTS
jgi:hypothetical protein